MSEQEKNNKESMICLTPKPSRKFSKIILYGLHQAQTLTPLIMLYEAF